MQSDQDITENQVDTLTPLPEETPKNIPIELIIEYATKGLSTRQIAKLLNCCHQNIAQRLQPYRDTIYSLPHYKKHRADILTTLQSQILNSIDEKDIKDASVLQRLTGFGILYDKERTERGLDKQGSGDTNVQVNINFDPSLIPGSGGTVQLKASTSENKQIEGGGGEADPGTPK